jgi:enoyl-CoA hydratase
MNEPNASPAILVEVRGSVAIVRFNRPFVRNSLSADVLISLDSVLSDLIPDHSLHAIIFTGADNAFLAGADIRELATLDPHSAHRFSSKGQQLFGRIAEAPQVTIAAINGYCMGGGLDFALACDIRIASSTAIFSHPGARLGIITGWGGTQRLPRIVGKARAIEFFATARRLPSAEAQRIGLITEICDPVLEGALALAAKLAISTP